MNVYQGVDDMLQDVIRVLCHKLLLLAYLAPRLKARDLPSFQIIFQCWPAKLHINEIEGAIAFELTVSQNLHDVRMASFAQFVERTHFIVDIFFSDRAPRSNDLPGEVKFSCWIV